MPSTVLAKPQRRPERQGVTRNIDDLGRIVIPIETRKLLGLGPNDPVVITQRGREVIIARPGEPCAACQGTGTELRSAGAAS